MPSPREIAGKDARKPFWAGFTLAELLIALVILGVIATFTIPKILQSQQDNRWKAAAKEQAAMLGTLYQQYFLQNPTETTVTLGVLMQQSNYIKKDTAGTLIDNRPPLGSLTCNAANPCYTFANGTVVMAGESDLISLSSPNISMSMYVDPDGVYSGATNGMGKSCQFLLYGNGRISVLGGAMQPTWFDWN